MKKKEKEQYKDHLVLLERAWNKLEEKDQDHLSCHAVLFSPAMCRFLESIFEQHTEMGMERYKAFLEDTATRFTEEQKEKGEDNGDTTPTTH